VHETQAVFHCVCLSTVVLHNASIHQSSRCLFSYQHSNKDTSTVVIIGCADNRRAKDICGCPRHCLVASPSPHLAVDTSGFSLRLPTHHGIQ
jgi:hypothetical protein